MRRKGLIALVALALLNALIAATALSASPVRNLKPGETETLEQVVPVNIVLVGFDRGQVNETALLEELPASYEPIVRYPPFYGLEGRDLGLRHVYKYNLFRAGEGFQDRLFSYMDDIGEPGPPTLFQELYNEQQNNIRDISGDVLYIDAPSVENWLMENGQRTYGFSRRSYTVYFINWYNDDRFKFHVYTKTDDADPDTGYNFGEERQTRKMTAWGGSHGRTWFYDISAGPEAWTSNWNVDDLDLAPGDGDDDAVEDYRIPPIWEYDENGYRAPSALGTDLGYLTRYVAINLLFTTSPLYDPLVTRTWRGGSKIVDTTLFEENPELSGRDLIRSSVITQKLESFQPYYTWRAPIDTVDPIDPATLRTLQIFTELINEPDCWENFGTQFAQLFCYFDENLDQFVDPARPEDYVGPHFAFSATEETGNGALPLGFADDNWTNGTQSYIFSFLTPGAREAGYGFTVTTIHEFGHHIGMSHPHDGYDSELGLDYGPSDFFNFVWSGDHSATIMSYIDVNFSFGVFDRDNMYRWETAGYLNLANNLADDVLASPNAAQAAGLLRRADLEAGRARRSFERWNYRNAVTQARLAYLTTVDAANAAGVDPAQIFGPLRSQPVQNVPKIVDYIRFPDQ
jgi:hypothetical protein